MIFFVTAVALLVAWCGAVIYIRLRPSAPEGPLNSPPELALGTPLEAEPVVHGRLYHTITYTAPVVVGVAVVVMFVVLMVPVFHS
jgi:hypothetical protein